MQLKWWFPFVTELDPNGLAYSKGIREKDILIKVNELDVSSFHIEEHMNIDTQLSLQNREEVIFTFKCNDEIIVIPVSKSDINKNRD